MLQNPLQKATCNMQKWVQNQFLQAENAIRTMQHTWCELYH